MSERLHIPVTGDNSNFVASMKGAQDAVRKTARQVEESGLTIEQTFDRMRKAALGFAAGFSVKEFAQKVVQIRGQFQQLEVAFNTMLGSAEKANDLMQQLTKTAAITPFDLQGVTDGAKQLLAYGIEAEEVNDTLIHLGDIAAGLSLPLTDLVYLYGTTMVQGRMFTQDLRQFQNRGIPIAEELAKVLGVTKDKVGELITAGKVGAKEFNQAIMAMSSEGGKFGGLMEAQSRTITGQISNIEDAIDVMFNNIGKQSEGIINSTLSVVASLVENYEEVGKVIASVVATYGVYKAAVMTVCAIQSLQAAGIGALTTAEAVHYGWLVLVQKAQALLNATMLANPYVLVATAIAALTASIYFLATAEDAETAARRRANEQMEDFKNKLEEQKKRINSYIQTLHDSNATEYEKAMAWENLKKEAPSLTEKYSQVELAAKDLGEAQKEVKEIMEQTEFEHAKNELAKWQKAMREAQDAQGNWTKLSKESKEAIQDFFGHGFLNNALPGIQERINLAKAEVDKFVRHYNQQAENAKPIEIRIKEANENVQETQKILSFYDEAITLAHQVERATNDVDYSEARQKFDEYIAKIKKDVEDLEKAIEENPMDVKLQLEKEEKERMYNELIAVKNSWMGIFSSPIPIWFTIKYTTAKNEADAATSGERQGMHFVKSMVGREQDAQGNFGYWEADKKETRMTPAQQRKAAYQELQQAKKLLSDFDKSSTQYTTEEAKKERKKLQDAVDEAEKKYKAFGGKTTKGSTTNKAKQEQNERERNQREYEAKQREMAKLREQLEADLSQSYVDAIENTQEKEIAQLQHSHQQEMVELEQEKQEYIRKKTELMQAKAKAEGKKFDPKTAALSEEEAKKFATLYDNILKKQAEETSNLFNHELDSMYEYLSQYGSVEQMRLAIRKDYNRKIEEEDDKWRKRTLAKERDAALEKTTADNLLQNIDLSTMFSDYGIIMAAPLEEALKRLKEYTTTDSFKARSFDDQKDIYDTIQSVERQLNGIGGISFSEVGQSLYEYNNALLSYKNASKEMETAAKDVIESEEAVEKAKKALANATTAEAKAAAQAALQSAKQKNDEATAAYDAKSGNFNRAQSALVAAQSGASESLRQFQDSIDKVGKIASAVASGSMKQLWEALGTKTQTRIGEFISGTHSFNKGLETITKTLSSQGRNFDYLTEKVQEMVLGIIKSGDDIEGSDIGGKISEMFEGLFGKDGSVKDVTDKVIKAIENIEIGDGEEDETGEKTKKAVKDAITEALNGSGGSLWAMIVGLVLDMLDVLEQGIGNLVDGLLTKIGDAISGILSEIGSGKFFVNLAHGVGSLVGGIVKGVANLFSGGYAFGGSNVGEMEDEIARLAEVNQQLAKSIDSLSKSISKNDNTNKQSIDAYKKALDAEKEWEQNQRKAIDNRASEWSNSGHGFLGLGGRHSYNANFNDSHGGSWYGWSDFNKVLRENGYNTTVRKAEDIWNLSPEMMQLLRDYAPKAWAEVINYSDGESNPSALIDEYIDRAGKIEELTSALNEKLTGYSWDGFLDSYKSLLKDLTSDTEDFGDKIEEIISNALIESLVNEEFKERIQTLYKYIADHAGDGLDESELNYIRSKNERIANDMIARRQNLVDAGLIKPSKDVYEQNASTGSWQGMSENTGQELNGRFTALQVAGENISQGVITLIANMTSLTSMATDRNNTLGEIRNLMIFNNAYLEDILEVNRTYYKSFAKELAAIKSNTK